MTRRQQELFPELPSEKKYVSDYPHLVSEWHHTKNGNHSPADFLHGSNKKVWWICTRGHEWRASIVNRVRERGCPYCSNRRACSDNNLLVVNPQLAKYWSPQNDIPPSQVLPHSGKNYKWLCEKGHEWESSPNNLAKKKFLCPDCEHIGRSDGLRKATPKKNLSTENPSLLSEWNHDKNEHPASFYMPRSNDKVWWKCSFGHDWEATIDSRTRGSGCPYCGNTLASPEHNLSELYPELMSEWHPTKNDLSPQKYRPQSNKEVWWKCAKGHEWKAPIYRRTGGSGCRNCSNQSSKNEIRIYIELSSIFDDVRHRHKAGGIEIDVFLPRYNLAIEYDGKYWHKDKADQDVKKAASLYDHGIKLLRVREAPLTKLQSHDLIIPMGSLLTKPTLDKIVLYIASKDTPAIEYLKSKEFVDEDKYLTYLDYFPSPFPENSLAVVNPSLAAEWHPFNNAPLTPDNFTAGSGHRAWWLCEKGHEWQSVIGSRNLGGHACPTCKGFKASSQNCMAITHPHLAKLFHPSKNGNNTPFNLKAGSGKKLWWRCEKGHEWQQTGDKLKRLTSRQKCSQCRALKPSSVKM